MNQQETFIRSVLGDGIEEVTLTVLDRSWRDWKRQIRSGKLLEYEVQAHIAEHKLLSNLVEQFWPSCHCFNIRLWSNFGWNVLAVPEMPVLEILKYECVGIHNQSNELMRKTHEAVASVYNQCPFEILFADPAGLQAAFLEPVSEQQAFEFEDLIYTNPLLSLWERKN